MLDARHSTLLVPGAEPFLYEGGPREVGCLLLHGFTSAPFEMRGLGRYLSDRGITAAAPLLAGHGTSPEELRRTNWHDWYASASEAFAILRERCSSVYVAGLSLGAVLALYMAAQRQADVAGVVAMSAPLYVPHGLAFALRRLHYGVPYVRKPFRDIQDREARARHVSYDRTPLYALASVFELTHIMRRLLSQVRVPALVIYARHDHIVPPVSSRLIYRRLGSADKRIIALDRGFHIVTVDTDRQKVYAAVYDFVQGVRC